MIPGFKETIDNPDYQNLISGINKSGYSVIFVQINWDYSTIIDWIEDFYTVFNKHKSKDYVIAGFSFGAVTAFCASAELKPSELWLFSLSPYFDDDLDIIRKKYSKLIGKRRIEAFEKLDFDKLCFKISCTTKIFYGEVEAKKYPTLKKRCVIANQKINNSSLFIIKDTDHKINDHRYINAIINNI